jgi:hypothetical protein
VLKPFDELVSPDIRLRLRAETAADLRRCWDAVRVAQSGGDSLIARAFRHVLLNPKLEVLLVRGACFADCILERDLIQMFAADPSMKDDALLCAALLLQTEHQIPALTVPGVVLLLLRRALLRHSPPITDDWSARQHEIDPKPRGLAA